MRTSPLKIPCRLPIISSKSVSPRRYRMTLLGRKAGGRRAAFSAFPGPGPHRLHPPGAGGGGALPRPSRPGRLAGPATAAAGQPESLFVKRKPGRRQRRLPGFSRSPLGGAVCNGYATRTPVPSAPGPLGPGDGKKRLLPARVFQGQLSYFNWAPSRKALPTFSPSLR